MNKLLFLLLPFLLLYCSSKTTTESFSTTVDFTPQDLQEEFLEEEALDEGLPAPAGASLIKVNRQKDGTFAFTFTKQQRIQARVIFVGDGDTFTVSYQEKTFKVRFSDIDAPESSQEYGQTAKAVVLGLAFQKDVELLCLSNDRRYRLVARIFVLPERLDLVRELVATGNAWWYEAYSKDTELRELESEARAHRLGLWAVESPQSPWEFRALKYPR